MPQVIDAGVAYLALKTAQKLYQKSTAALQVAEFDRVQKMAQQQFQLEAKMLLTAEARDVMVPPATVTAAMAEIRGRYPSAEEFVEDLARNGLDESSYASALEREMKVDAILEKVGSRSSKLNEIDIELYYQFHAEKFYRPETRQVRHILITINETIAENTREAAQQRIAIIAQRLTKEPQRFEEQALKHSECPTALDGGKLGDLPRGKLFLVLDAVLFELNAGDISGVLESELGFHLLRCDAITAATWLSLEQARPHIKQLMESQRKRICQQAWMKQLLGKV
jgi:nitrogen fixation protein NifM